MKKMMYLHGFASSGVHCMDYPRERKARSERTRIASSAAESVNTRNSPPPDATRTALQPE